MIYPQKTIVLRDGREAVFRSPTPADAAGMMQYLKTCAAETDYILRYPEECDETPEQEAQFLDGVVRSPYSLMIVCTVAGEIAGNCQMNVQKRLKTRHRASVAIALIRKYWGLGIGTAMFEEMIAVAREQGVRQLELGYIEGNQRARALYRKMGFTEYGALPNAIRLKDGTLLRECLMIRAL